MTNLETLCLSGSYHVEGLSFLSSLTNLTKLNAKYLSSISTLPITQLTDLVSLDISFTEKKVDDYIVDQLYYLCKLKSLKMAGSAITSQGLMKLCSLLDLELLNLRNCTNILDIGALASLRQLTHLDLYKCKISNFGNLTALGNLRYVHLTDQIHSKQQCTS